VAGDAELALLCQSCGFCCDGSLFGRVDLEPEEVAPARANRLHVVRDRSFEQPCTALRSDAGQSSCSIYEQRPHACRRFSCRLHERHLRESGPLEPRLEAVRRVRELVAYLQDSGFGPADFEDRLPGRPGAPDQAHARAFSELSRRLEEDFAPSEASRAAASRPI